MTGTVWPGPGPKKRGGTFQPSEAEKADQERKQHILAVIQYTLLDNALVHDALGHCALVPITTPYVHAPSTVRILRGLAVVLELLDVTAVTLVGRAFVVLFASRAIVLGVALVADLEAREVLAVGQAFPVPLESPHEPRVRPFDLVIHRRHKVLNDLLRDRAWES